MKSYLRILFVVLFYISLALSQGTVYMRGTNPQVNIDYQVKTPAHPEFGYGFPEGYTVDNLEGPTLILEVNPLDSAVGFRFKVSNNVPCDYHPVYLTTDPSGQNVQASIGEIFTGVQERNASDSLCQPGVTCACQGGSLVWTPTTLSSQLPVGSSYYYQCRIHSKMGGPVIVQYASTCDIATNVIGANANLTLTAFSNQILTTANTSMPNFFNGALTGGTNWMRGSVNFTRFVNSHASFFGQLFTCNDGSLANYTGRSMQDAHAAISNFVTNTEWTNFITYFRNTFLNFFSTPEARGYLLPRFTSLLASQKRYICRGDPNCRTTLCDVYTDVANYTGRSEVWLFQVVNDTFSKLDPNLYPSLAGYLTPGPLQTQYLNKLVYFLARELNCSQANIPKYNLTDQQLVSIHSAFTIDQLQYEGYIRSLLDSFNDFGMAPADQDEVARILTRLGLAGICNQPNCDPTFQKPITFVFSIQQGKISHPWRDGYNASFVIDGTEARNLTIFVGRSYIFLNNAPCNFPLYISTSPYGGRNSAGPIQPVLSGVTNQDSAHFYDACAGNSFYFTPTLAEAQGPQLYYQSAYQERVGFYLNVCTPDFSSCSSGSPPLSTTGAATTGGNRVSAGSTILPSKWIVVMAFLLAIFLFHL